MGVRAGMENRIEVVSVMIKPEDVPDEFACKHCVHIARGSMEDIMEDIAAILNAAIEAGIVSPPVKAVRWVSGRLAKNWEEWPLVYPMGSGPKEDTDAFSYEHWKGQTE